MTSRISDKSSFFNIFPKCNKLLFIVLHIILFQFFSIFFALEIYASVTVQIRVVDQNNIEIEGSQISISGIGTFDTGLSITISEGIYNVTIIPAILGAAQNNLKRTETVEIVSNQTELTFEWITADVTLDVVDQDGIRIIGSKLQLMSTDFIWYEAGTLVTLPITDENTYPLIYGPWADGYDIYIKPGVLGSTQNGLTRIDSNGKAEVMPSQTELTFEWITADVTLDVVDQNGLRITGSKLQLMSTDFIWYDAGTVVTLPITDENEYQNIIGPWANGYDIYIKPGVLGSSQNGLIRIESVGVTEVYANQNELMFEWPVTSCYLSVVDSSGINDIPGATFSILSMTFNSGDSLSLPITDNDYFPTIIGSLDNGFDITLNTYFGSGTFKFEVNANYTYDPDFVTIGENQFGLRCILNNPPIADAGDNFFIYSFDQITTVINGSGYDLDTNDSLTFSWFENDTRVQAEQPVGENGEAFLQLGNLQPLSLGNHNFTLIVSDGELNVSDSVIVSVNNSPPEVVCSGSGIYQVGVDDVSLEAAVSDFDGDDLIFRWKLNDQILSSGQIETIEGGTPVNLPSTILSASEDGTGDLGIGSHIIFITIADGVNDSLNCQVFANVIDTQAPSISPIATPNILWPPNHEMVDVSIVTNAVDNSGAEVLLSVVVSSTEDPDKDGDGNTIPDFTTPVIDQESGIITLQLRSERSGRGKGRTYTITIMATDTSNNTSIASVNIIAPHNRGNK